MLKTNRGTVWAYVIKSSWFLHWSSLSCIWRALFIPSSRDHSWPGRQLEDSLLTEERRRRRRRRRRREERRGEGETSLRHHADFYRSLAPLIGSSAATRTCAGNSTLFKTRRFSNVAAGKVPFFQLNLIYVISFCYLLATYFNLSFIKTTFILKFYLEDSTKIFLFRRRLSFHSQQGSITHICSTLF